MSQVKTKELDYVLENEFRNITDVANPERLEILFDENVPDWESEDNVGGVFRFSKSEFSPGNPITIQIVETLQEKGYLSFKQYHNQAPTIGKFVEKAKEINDIAPDSGKCRFTGYVVSPDRRDCRITIDGVRYDGKVTNKVREKFKEEFGTGYEFSESDEYLRRWFD